MYGYNDYDKPFNKKHTLHLLRKRGIAQVVLEYAGGNDEGGVEGHSFLDAEGKGVPICTESFRQLSDYDSDTGMYKTERWVVRVPATSPPEVREATPQEIEDALLVYHVEAPIYNRFGSFAGEFNVSGRLTIDVPAGTVKMEHNVSVSQYEEEEVEL